MFDVQSSAFWFQQRALYQKLQYWRTRSAIAASHDFLFDIYCPEALPCGRSER
jgi:hypothetical protein